MIKKFSILICFMFVLAFGSVVSANEVQSKDADSSVVISEDEYNDLLNRITELENLKSDEINNNLLEFYEKSNAKRESNMNFIYGAFAFIMTAFGVGVGILGFNNYNSAKNAIKKSEEAIKDSEKAVTNIEYKSELIIKKADKNIEKVEKLIEKSEEKNNRALKNVTENSEKTIKENTKKVDETIEKANLSIGEVNANLEEYKKIIKMQDIYKRKIIADSFDSLEFKIKSYSKIIVDLEKFNIVDGFIYFERADAYRKLMIHDICSKFKNQYYEISSNLCLDLEVETNLSFKIRCFSVLNYTKNDRYYEMLENAILDYNVFLSNNKLSDSDDNIALSKMKLFECYVYKADYDKAFGILAMM